MSKLLAVSHKSKTELDQVELAEDALGILGRILQLDAEQVASYEELASTTKFELLKYLLAEAIQSRGKELGIDITHLTHLAEFYVRNIATSIAYFDPERHADEWNVVLEYVNSQISAISQFLHDLQLIDVYEHELNVAQLIDEIRSENPSLDLNIEIVNIVEDEKIITGEKTFLLKYHIKCLIANAVEHHATALEIRLGRIASKFIARVLDNGGDATSNGLRRTRNSDERYKQVYERQIMIPVEKSHIMDQIAVLQTNIDSFKVGKINADTFSQKFSFDTVAYLVGRFVAQRRKFGVDEETLALLRHNGRAVLSQIEDSLSALLSQKNPETIAMLVSMIELQQSRMVSFLEDVEEFDPDMKHLDLQKVLAKITATTPYKKIKFTFELGDLSAYNLVLKRPVGYLTAQINELLLNSQKHLARNITISATVVGNQVLVITVTDDGTGISQERAVIVNAAAMNGSSAGAEDDRTDSHGDALALMGSIYIAPRPEAEGTGTIVRLSVPLAELQGATEV